MGVGDVALVLKIIRDELGEVLDKHANKRRTQITNAARDLDVEDLIAEEDMVVTVSRTGYVKRLPVATYRQQKRGGKGLQGVDLKEADIVEHLFISSTHDHVLFFSTKGKVYRMKVHELPVGSRHARGTAVVNLLPFTQDEKIAAVITTKDFGADDYLLFATKRGMVKKTAMQAYSRVLSSGIIAINLRGDDPRRPAACARSESRAVIGRMRLASGPERIREVSGSRPSPLTRAGRPLPIRRRMPRVGRARSWRVSAWAS